MHPYLAKLGVPDLVQAFFSPYYHADANGNLRFVYGSEAEVYGLGFQHVPATNSLWTAGNDLGMIRQVFVCTSAMDAIAFYALNYIRFQNPDHLLFVAMGLRPCKQHTDWIAQNLPNRAIRLLFGNDLISRVTDVKIAAALRGLPLTVTIAQDAVNVWCRFRDYGFTTENFSLNQLEKQSGQRFRCRTDKPRDVDSWLKQIEQILAKK